MSYAKLLSARGKSGKPPTMEKTKMSADEKLRARKGVCIKCGLNAAGKSSYICPACQSEDSLDDIQNEIQALRRRLLE